MIVKRLAIGGSQATSVAKPVLAATTSTAVFASSVILFPSKSIALRCLRECLNVQMF